MKQLAINGGPKIRTELFPSQDTFDWHEYNAVTDVMYSGRLSNYRANWTDDFYGGPKIKELEENWSHKFGSKYSIAVNSATSGLIAACGAIGLKPSDEVIVTPYSMTCSATVPLVFGALPVFADIEEDYFCLDPEDIKRKITKKTKAIIVVSLFGQPYNQEINKIAKEHGIYVIEDAAQAPGAMYKDKYTGTLANIGVFSFNYGKHINSGEGGIITTDNELLNFRCRLLANHGEAVINDLMNDEKQRTNGLKNIIGFNLRMTELTAAVVIEQLKKFDDLLEKRLKNVIHLDGILDEIDPINITNEGRWGTYTSPAHTFYALSYIWNNTKLHRDKYIEAVKAELMPRKDRDTEGVPIGCGYIKPIYLMPLFQARTHWALKEGSYYKGLCPVAEDLWKNKLFLTLLHAPNSTIGDMDDVGKAFVKVWENKNEL